MALELSQIHLPHVLTSYEWHTVHGKYRRIYIHAIHVPANVIPLSDSEDEIDFDLVDQLFDRHIKCLI